MFFCSGVERYNILNSEVLTCLNISVQFYYQARGVFGCSFGGEMATQWYLLKDNRGEERFVDNPAYAAEHARKCVQEKVSVKTANPVNPVIIELWPCDANKKVLTPKPARRFFSQ
jgi:hypothetical protein